MAPSASLSSPLSTNSFFLGQRIAFRELYIPSVARELPLFRPLQTRTGHNNKNALCVKSASRCSRENSKEKETRRKSHDGKLKETTRRDTRLNQRPNLLLPFFSSYSFSSAFLLNLSASSSLVSSLPRAFPGRLFLRLFVHRSIILCSLLRLAHAKLNSSP